MAPLKEGGKDAFMGASDYDYQDSDWEYMYHAQASDSYTQVRVTSNPINYGTSLSRGFPESNSFLLPIS